VLACDAGVTQPPWPAVDNTAFLTLDEATIHATCARYGITLSDDVELLLAPPVAEP
jgi:hypothetical protein